MKWYDVVSLTFGTVGVLLATRFYLELRKWAYLIKYNRVVVAYKSKVKLNAPLQEWALWCRQADKPNSGTGPERHGGRVIYQLGGTSIAVLSKSFVPDSPLKRAWHRVKRPRQSGAPRAQEGTWSAKDQTTKVT